MIARFAAALLLRELCAWQRTDAMLLYIVWHYVQIAISCLMVVPSCAIFVFVFKIYTLDLLDNWFAGCHFSDAIEASM